VIEKDVDRLCELANIGAGHAAGAFSQLTGQPIVMEVPVVSTVAQPLECASDDEHQRWSSGVIFEFDGCLPALVGILFRQPMSDAVVERMLGAASEEGYPVECVEGVLMEVGNILASHVASAIADTLGARLLPSIPTLALDNADEQLASLAEARGSGDAMRIECRLRDGASNLGGLVVLILDPINF
jgi:chemotaxis protein CheC